MKNIFLLFITILLLIFPKSITFAEKWASINTLQNTELNIKWAKLIEKYLKSLINNLNNIKERYNLDNNIKLNLYVKKLDQMILSLQKTQNTDLSKQEAEKIMRNIINELKILNPKVKSLLNSEKEKQKREFEKIKTRFNLIWVKLSKSLDKIILKILLPIKEKANLTDKDKKIIKHLKNLKKESDKLKNLQSKSYIDKEAMRVYLIKILKDIKKELKNIKFN